MMISGFFLIITLGHLYCGMLVMWLSSTMYKEIVLLKRKEEKDRKILFSWIDWYYFAVFAFYMIPKVILRRVLLEGNLTHGGYMHFIMYDYHNLITFALAMIGVLLFVLSLERGTYRYQFQRLSWSILALILVFSMPLLVSYNIYKGIFWLVFPHMCVIVNDIFAYLFGFFMGKTPLIKLSPKKTWEGFFGGIFGTYLWAVIVISFRLLIDIDYRDICKSAIHGMPPARVDIFDLPEH